MYIPVVIVEDLNGHIPSPLDMPGFKDLSKTTRANHLPPIQAQVTTQNQNRADVLFHGSTKIGKNLITVMF